MRRLKLMIHAYDKIYLTDAQKSLGLMLDVAVNEWNFDINDFYSKFLNSMESLLFSKGDARTIAGKSGIELGYDVLGNNSNRTSIDLPINRSPEYWTGWVLAYYQWYTGLSFQIINEEIPIEIIIDMYNPYHEMDISCVVGRMNEIRQANRCISYLKKFRLQMDMTQKELSEATEIPIKTIQQYEQRQKNINKAQSEYVIKLAKTLGCEPEQLLEPDSK